MNIITDIICPQCRLNLIEVPDPNGEFDILFCRTCDIVFDVKLRDEEWDYIPTTADLPGSEN